MPTVYENHNSCPRFFACLFWCCLTQPDQTATETERLIPNVSSNSTNYEATQDQEERRKQKIQTKWKDVGSAAIRQSKIHKLRFFLAIQQAFDTKTIAVTQMMAVVSQEHSKMLACIFHERHASPGQKPYNNWLSKGF